MRWRDFRGRNARRGMGRNPGPKSWSFKGDQIEKIDGGDIGKNRDYVRSAYSEADRSDEGG